MVGSGERDRGRRGRGVKGQPESIDVQFKVHCRVTKYSAVKLKITKEMSNFNMIKRKESN